MTNIVRKHATLLREIKDRALYMRTVGGSCSNRKASDHLTWNNDTSDSGLTAETLVWLIEVVLVHAPADYFEIDCCPKCEGRMATDTEEGCTSTSCIIMPKPPLTPSEKAAFGYVDSVIDSLKKAKR